MRAIVNGRSVLVVFALLVTAALTACSANQAPGTAGPGDGQTTTPAATTAASRPVTSQSASSAGSTSVQNLVITSAGKSELTAMYVAWRGIALADISGAGPLPGSVYYAYDPATETYWALAEFEPSSAASLDVQVGFQDGGGTAMYRKAGAGPWQMGGNPGFPEFCGEVKYFPAAVLTAWSISAPPGLTCRY